MPLAIPTHNPISIYYEANQAKEGCEFILLAHRVDNIDDKTVLF